MAEYLADFDNVKIKAWLDTITNIMTRHTGGLVRVDAWRSVRWVSMSASEKRFRFFGQLVV